MFCIDHFRPKSKFPPLRNSMGNLYYCCPVCNTFKGDDWHDGDPRNPSVIGYYDPVEVDYGDRFIVESGHRIRGVCVKSRYMVERLCLNRPQLVLARHYKEVSLRIAEASKKYTALSAVLSVEQKARFADLLAKLLESMSQFRIGIPYTSSEVKRGKDDGCG